MESFILEDHSGDGKRSGEGAAVALADGRLLLIYGQFDGAADDSPARLVSRISADGGRTWTVPERFVEPRADWINVMSVSLLRLQDNRLAAVFLARSGPDLCIPYWMTSADEAQTWTTPCRMIDGEGFHVVNNDRLVQLADGRILLPYKYGASSVTPGHMPLCGVLRSDDAGETWRHGIEEIRVLPENYRIPHDVVPDRTPALRIFGLQQVFTNEPGVVELADGTVLMWARSNGGYTYAARSTDRGETWSPFKILCDTPMAVGPATIKRLPGSQRLLMLHNDRTGIPFGHALFQFRAPLAVSTSDDEGRTWQRRSPLAADPGRSYCYFSMCFHDRRCLISTYESVDRKMPDGSIHQRTLASLRLFDVSDQWWFGP